MWCVGMWVKWVKWVGGCAAGWCGCRGDDDYVGTWVLSPVSLVVRSTDGGLGVFRLGGIFWAWSGVSVEAWLGLFGYEGL